LDRIILSECFKRTPDFGSSFLGYRTKRVDENAVSPCAVTSYEGLIFLETILLGGR
jgi:hypothetical protein